MRYRKAVAFGLTLLLTGLGLPIIAPALSQSPAAFRQSGTATLGLPNCLDSFSQFLTTCYQAWYFLQTMFPDDGVPTALGLQHVAVQSYWTSPNGTVWYFRITPGATWSDGVAANATDLAWSIQQMYTTYSWGAGSLVAYTHLLKGNSTDSVRAVNSSVVEVQLNQRFSLLGDIIGAENTPNLTPYHVWKNWINGTTAPGTLFGTLVGTGPYYVSNFHQGDQQIVMLPNPYPSPWASSNNQGHPYFSKIVTQLVPSSSSLATLLLGGQIDAAAVAPADVAGLLSNPNIKVAATPGTGLWYIEFTQDNYPYNMPAVRHALAYAIDTHSLVQNALAGYGTVGNSAFIPPASPEFNSSVPSYSYNPNMTKQLLQSVGFKLGSDGFFTFPNGTAFQPNLYVPAEQTPIVLAGTLVVQQLQAAGINAQLRTIAGASMASIWYQGINMYFEEQNFGYPNSELLTDGSFYAYFTSQGPAFGHQAFVDKAVSKHYNDTVAALENATTSAQIVQYEEALQGIIATSLPSVPLFYPDFIWAYNSQTVAGWPQSPASLEVPGGTFNITALATIYSPSSVTQTTTGVSSTSTSPGAASGGLDSTIIAGGVIVAAIIVVAGAMLMRRKPKQ